MKNNKEFALPNIVENACDWYRESWGSNLRSWNKMNILCPKQLFSKLHFGTSMPLNQMSSDRTFWVSNWLDGVGWFPGEKSGPCLDVRTEPNMKVNFKLFAPCSQGKWRPLSELMKLATQLPLLVYCGWLALYNVTLHPENHKEQGFHYHPHMFPEKHSHKGIQSRVKSTPTLSSTHIHHTSSTWID